MLVNSLRGALSRKSPSSLDSDPNRADAIRRVLKAVSDDEVGFLRLWFTDVLGFLKSFAIPAEELDKAFERGVIFDGSAIEGFSRLREEDLVARPDPYTFQILPWRPESRTATMFCDIYAHEEEPFPSDPRAILRRQLATFEAEGLVPFIGPEIEFFLFRDESGVQPLDRGTYFDVPIDISSDFRRTVTRYLEQLGIPVEASHHEVAASQHEIDLRFSDALTMADSVMAFRLTVKEAAREFGIYATFMPKPIQGAWGSGMHLHTTLMQGERNVFSGESPEGVSEEGRSFVAGLLHHAPEITAVTNQWVNSCKRLIVGYEAPVHIAWARRNRSALVRVPPGTQGRSTGGDPLPRCGLQPLPRLRPYPGRRAGRDALRHAASSGGGTPPEDMSPAELEDAGIRALPETLAEAVGELERSQLVRSVLGDHAVEWIVRNKLAEWEDYRRQVTPMEIERYLPTL